MPRTSSKPRTSNRTSPDVTTTQAQQRFAQAFALHQQGRLAQAQALYEQVLAMLPGHSDALHMTGVIALQTGKCERAAAVISQALQIDPGNADAHYNRGIALESLGRQVAAIASYEQALVLKPSYAAAYNNCAIALKDLDPPAALRCFGRAIALLPDFAEALNNCGNVLRDLQRHAAALHSYERAIALAPGYVQAYCNRGLALTDLGRNEAALSSYRRALALKPGDADAHDGCGIALDHQQQPGAALQCFELAIALRPDYADAYNNRGSALRGLRRHAAALASIERALALQCDHAAAHNNRGVTLRELAQSAAALTSFEHAIALDPRFADAYYNHGNALRDFTQLEAALHSLARALALRPDCPYLYGLLLHTKMHLCDWTDQEPEFLELTAKIERGEQASIPFAVLAISDAPALQRKAAEIWMQAQYPPRRSLPELRAHARHDKIRVGYYSADFHDHPTAYLIAELFERHDRTKFELTAFSFGPQRNDAMRRRLAAAFDRFIDVSGNDDTQVAALSRELAIDIAIDLKGYTHGSRPGIFAARAAPLQVGYLGYPGTMGASYIDYLIADRTLIPPESQRHYCEQIIYLPDSYQVNDGQRAIAERSLTREQAGLPPTGFVYCCFNNNYKITRAAFDGWMRILERVDGSVLWLLEGSAAAAGNLLREAQARGISPERLVFAKRMPMPEHLARQRLADILLDTLPCNAHTTASDALWAGLPVLTRAGESFAGRVAASLLNAIGLPELVTKTQEQYEALAVELAEHPQRLLDLRLRLERNRRTAPLFDTRRFAENCEAAYAEIYERQQADLPPDHIYIGD